MLDEIGTPTSIGGALPHQRNSGIGDFDLSIDVEDEVTDSMAAEVGFVIDAEDTDAAVDLTLLSLPDLRDQRTRLTELEGRVSYWRRIIQARLDLLRDGSLKRGATVEGLQRVLSQQLGPNNRKMLLDVDGAGDEAPPVTGLGDLWSRGINTSPEDDYGLESDLANAERLLSERRSELHGQIDAATAELVARYRDNPSLALSAIPSRAPRPSPL